MHEILRFAQKGVLAGSGPDLKLYVETETQTLVYDVGTSSKVCFPPCQRKPPARSCAAVFESPS